MTTKYKCRPADADYHDDPYYVREFVAKDARDAASKLCADICTDHGEYREMDAQVLTPEGWVTFEVAVVSVPEFMATPKRGVPPVPPTFKCEGCDQRKPASEETHDGSYLCKACEAEEARLDAEEEDESDE